MYKHTLIREWASDIALRGRCGSLLRSIVETTIFPVILPTCVLFLACYVRCGTEVIVSIAKLVV